MKNEKLERVTPILVFLSICAPFLDAIENGFILLTLTDLLGFPDWYAFAHSAFALPKWIILGTLLLVVLIGYIIRKIKKIE